MAISGGGSGFFLLGLLSGAGRASDELIRKEKYAPRVRRENPVAQFLFGDRVLYDGYSGSDTKRDETPQTSQLRAEPREPITWIGRWEKRKKGGEQPGDAAQIIQQLDAKAGAYTGDLKVAAQEACKALRGLVGVADKSQASQISKIFGVVRQNVLPITDALASNGGQTQDPTAAETLKGVFMDVVDAAAKTGGSALGAGGITQQAQAARLALQGLNAG